jgi:hypothetical protein
LNHQTLSGTQRFFTRWVDADTAAAMEAHSRAWLVQCPNCSLDRSIWEIGGIRYKAAGQPRLRLSCPRCAESGWHKVYKAADFPNTQVSAWPLVRMIILFSLLSTLAIAALVFGILKLAGAF